MNGLDILKGILGGNATGSKRIEKIQKRSEGGGLGDVLGSVLGGGRSREQRRGSVPTNPRDAARELEDFLGIGKEDRRRREVIPQAEPVRQRQPERRPDLSPPPMPRRRQPRCEHEEDDSATLIRAMCNAAKVDGDIDRAEQDAILSRIQNVGREELDFVRAELAAPLDLEAYCDTVPPRLAEQVYAFSVLTIKLDTLREAAYLGRLSSALELDSATCNAIHEKVGAPCIFS